MKAITFGHHIGSSKFAETLSQRVNNYFLQQQTPRYGNWEMLAKTVLGFTAFIATYIWLISDWLTPLGLLGVYVLHGFAQLHIALNIAHDACHDAYSKNKKINRLLGYSFDLVGVSSYMWRLIHNDSHHFFINIRGVDQTIDYGRIMRVSPRVEWRRFHRFQHIYAPFLYCLASLDWVFSKDYRRLLLSRFGNRKITRHPRKELVILFAAKTFYYTYMIVLPIILLSVSWLWVILGFIVMHLFLGFALAVIFQANHFTEKSAFPEPDGRGQISDNYMNHIFSNSADYAHGNPLVCWSVGGLNLHVIHHLFPKVCHIHYPALTEILKATAQEHGLAYPEHKTMVGAFIAHLRWMKILGREDKDFAPVVAQ